MTQVNLKLRGETVYIINLDKDTQKLDQATRRLDRLGVNVVRVPGAKCESKWIREDIWLNETIFAAMSVHQHIIEEAMKRDDPYVWIFEDDVMPRDDAEKIIDKAIDKLDTLQWDVFYLGANIVKYPERCSPHLSKIWGTCGHLHAYCVSKAGYQKAIDYIVGATKLREIHPDQFPPSMERYLVNPIVAVQDPAYADRMSEYFRFYIEQDFVNNCSELKSRESFMQRYKNGR